MESFKPQEIDCPLVNYCRNKRQRAIRELASFDVTMISDVKRSKDDAGTVNPHNYACLSHGEISVIGRRRTMEDTVKVVAGVAREGYVNKFDFFSVYDGHGGAAVANACRDRLHQLLANEIDQVWRDGDKVLDWQKVMSSCFTKMEQEVAENTMVLASGEMIGSTAVVVVVGRVEVAVANCGDSRAVMGRGGVALQLSRDHKPDRPDERERIEAAGGRIINWNGNRVLGVLATSRSIGDFYLKPYVICEPEVTVFDRTESDEFLIIASDGLWDVVSNELGCEVVRRCLDGQTTMRFPDGFVGSCAAQAAALLAELALARGSRDNISVIVVQLKTAD
ncbi:putative Protein phosphatase 2c [Quillaja saponaria]|uniref:protein-serine/threonine phosphatase n=1 Tax=Quillaja saponaria TaxID=32244 RepID=A0AAD7PEP5_QUISA|nr:putative Protein phosphatase 2c [Quillaja saponaria]